MNGSLTSKFCLADFVIVDSVTDLNEASFFSYFVSCQRLSFE